MSVKGQSKATPSALRAGYLIGAALATFLGLCWPALASPGCDAVSAGAWNGTFTSHTFSDIFAAGDEVTFVISTTNPDFAAFFELGGVFGTSGTVAAGSPATVNINAMTSGIGTLTVAIDSRATATVTVSGGTCTAHPFPPTINSVSPNSGPALGGTTVTISGQYFTHATGVLFGNIYANFTLNSDTQITATAPPGKGTVDITVVTPTGPSVASASSKYAYIGGQTTTTLTSSPNPSQPGQMVTFTATVTKLDGVPTGVVFFKDGSLTLGTGILAAGKATFLTPFQTLGVHSITAVYNGDASSFTSTSAVLLQSVNVVTDSVRLRQMQILATPTAANISGQMITGAIDDAIGSGFSDNPSPFIANGSGFTANLFTEADGRQTAAVARNDGLNDFLNNPSQRSLNRRMDDSFAALGYANDKMPTKAEVKGAPVMSRDWLAWVDFRGVSVARYSTNDDLKGNQASLLLGLTRKLSPSVLVGGFGGYEYFKYTSDTLNSQLKGNGWTLGAYAAWRVTSTLRIDVAAARSQVGFDASSGTASASFPGHRWLVSGGVTGDYKWQGFALQPSARIYGLWEHEAGYTDSLGVTQSDRNFETGRASAGLKVGKPMLSDTGRFTPYVGLYGDYYFTRDDANAINAGSVPLLQGWSARATGGFSFAVNKGMSADLGAEYGGIGSNTHIWTYRGRVATPF